MREPADRNISVWRMLWWGMILVVVVLTATAVLPLLPVDWWWIRIGDYPRLQLLIAYVACLPLLLFFRRCHGVKLAAAALLISSAIQVYWISDYLPFARPQVEAAQSSDPNSQLKVMVSNVLLDNRDTASLLELVARQKPDLLVLCEVNQRWADAIKPLDGEFRFHKVYPLENGYGMAFYSQLEVPRCEVRAMVAKEIPSIDADIVLRNGHKVRVFAVHPNPPRPGEDTTKRDAELILVGREIKDDPSAIVLGDMNDVGWSRTSDLFSEVSGLLDPRVGRGFYATFDATSRINRYPLDYVFLSDDFRVADMQVLPSIGSDHFPLWIQVSHEPSARATQEAPHLDAGDQEDAQDAVDGVKK